MIRPTPDGLRATRVTQLMIRKNQTEFVRALHDVPTTLMREQMESRKHASMIQPNRTEILALSFDWDALPLGERSRQAGWVASV